MRCVIFMLWITHLVVVFPPLCVSLSFSSFFHSKNLFNRKITLEKPPLLHILPHKNSRSLLQITSDSVSFYVVVTANETTPTQTAITLQSNATVEGFTSSATPVFVPASCPANSISPEGSISVTQCYCLPGYEGNASDGSNCIPCRADTFCASGKLGLCPANAHAPALSDSILDCSCYPGFHGNGSVSCTRCPANSFCTGGFALEVCTLNAISPAQSTVNASCYCDRGFYGEGNRPCTLCEPGSWCWTGIKNPCPNNSSSFPGSSRISNCVCFDGFEDTPVIDHDNQSTSICTLCHENVFCKVCKFPNPVYNTGIHFRLNAFCFESFFAFTCCTRCFISNNELPRRPDLARRLNVH